MHPSFIVSAAGSCSRVTLTICRILDAREPPNNARNVPTQCTNQSINQSMRKARLSIVEYAPLPKPVAKEVA